MQIPKPELMIPAFILSTLGIIFSGIVMAKGDKEMRPLAIIGLILGIIGLIFPIWAFVNILVLQLSPPLVPVT
jgi:hypothetical protein